MTTRFINRGEAADMLKLSVKTLANWATRSVGPKVYNPTGGRALYREEEVQNFVLGLVAPPPEPPRRRGRPPKSASRRA